jgi:hypothetical protein
VRPLRRYVRGQSLYDLALLACQVAGYNDPEAELLRELVAMYAKISTTAGPLQSMGE